MQAQHYDRNVHVWPACVHRYKRDDGLDLTGTLYLPPGYDKERDGRLPCILWAYPREFKTKVGPCVSLAPSDWKEGVDQLAGVEADPAVASYVALSC